MKRTHIEVPVDVDDPGRGTTDSELWSALGLRSEGWMEGADSHVEHLEWEPSERLIPLLPSLQILPHSNLLDQHLLSFLDWCLSQQRASAPTQRALHSIFRVLTKSY